MKVIMHISPVQRIKSKVLKEKFKIKIKTIKNKKGAETKTL